MTLHYELYCVAYVLTLIAKQDDTRIDLDSVLAFLCDAFLRLVTKNDWKLDIFAL